MTDKFGTLENVPLREAWPNEARDFTPWLANNLDRLESAIGIELEMVQTEAAVGQFSADILAHNPLDGSVVVIENQLEVSDHTHLGQITTYLSGLEARTVIWIARDFSSPHLSAIQRLNEETPDSFNVFAIRIKVMKIGDSQLAPVFEVLERPNDWYDRVRALTQKGSDGQLTQWRSRFWSYYVERYPNDGVPKNRRSSNVYHYVASADLRISQFVSVQGVGIFVNGRQRGEQPDSWLDRARPYGPALVNALGIDPEQTPVQFSPEYNGWYFAELWYGMQTSDSDNWPDAVDRLHELLTIYRRALETPVP